MGSIRKTNIQIIWIPEERKKGAESLFKEIIDENFLNLGKDLGIKVHKVNRTPYSSKAKRASPRNIIMKLSMKI